MRRFIVWTTLILPLPLTAQSLLYRAPNMGGTWVPDAAVVQFNFLHRFYVSPSPANGFNNFPTFTLAAGIGHGLSFGTMFATKGIHYYDIANASSTNETELFARWRVWGGAGKDSRGSPSRSRPPTTSRRRASTATCRSTGIGAA